MIYPLVHAGLPWAHPCLDQLKSKAYASSAGSSSGGWANKL